MVMLNCGKKQNNKCFVNVLDLPEITSETSSMGRVIFSNRCCSGSTSVDSEEVDPDSLKNSKKVS